MSSNSRYLAITWNLNKLQIRFEYHMFLKISKALINSRNQHCSPEISDGWYYRLFLSPHFCQFVSFQKEKSKGYWILLFYDPNIMALLISVFLELIRLMLWFFLELLSLMLWFFTHLIGHSHDGRINQTEIRSLNCSISCIKLDSINFTFLCTKPYIKVKATIFVE